MRIFIIAAIAAILLCYACGSGSTRDAEGGIRQAETDFAAMAGKEGVAAAFEHFAADSGVINRGGKSIRVRPPLRRIMRNGLTGR